MKSEQRKKPSKRLENILAVVALAIVIIAWFVGSFRAEADLAPFLKQAIPLADHFEPAPGGTYIAWKNSAKEQLIGYVTTGSADGYAGEIKMAVAVSPEGTIIGLAIIEQRETASFFQRVLRSGLLQSLEGKAYSDPFALDQDIDGVTGATYSSRALADAARRASRKVASINLGLPAIKEPSPPIQLGIPEAVLIALFVFGIIGRLKRFKYKKTARWVSMLVGLSVLGFIYNQPLTLVQINKMLLGFWSAWQTHLYWYLLLAGILFIYTIGNRNPYCEWFCPFGSTQECLGVIGGAKRRIPERFYTFLRWFQRALALFAIVLALLYRNPSISSYEVFGAFFHLIGSTFNFALLGVVLIASLFLRRPWCSYLCPLRPVTDFIRLVRNWVKAGWISVRVRHQKLSR